MKSIKHSSYGMSIWNEGSLEIGISVSRGSCLLVVGSCLLVEESCLLGTYYFVYLNVLQVMKRGRFLHQSSLRFCIIFPKDNKILFEL